MSAVYLVENINHPFIFQLIAVDPRDKSSTAWRAEETLETPAVKLFILTPPNDAANNLGFCTV
jgi:hypothetical protein